MNEDSPKQAKISVKPDPQTILAFDFGLRRIGVAVGNAMIETANPLETLHCPPNGPDWRAVERVIKEWRPDLIIVGLPLHIDDSPSQNAILAERFALEIEERVGISTLLVDEKLSSHAAKEAIKSARAEGLRKRTKQGDIDKFAAQVILRSWLNQREGRRPKTGGE